MKRGRIQNLVRNIVIGTIGATLIPDFSTELRAGTLSFASQEEFPTGHTPLSVIVEDVNKDGKRDVLTVSADKNNVSVLLGGGNSPYNWFLQANLDYLTGSGPVSLAVGDMNKDGKFDIITGGGNYVSELLGKPDSFGFFPSSNLYSYHTINSVAAADVNGDGALDVVTANGGLSNSIGVWQNFFFNNVWHFLPEKINSTDTVSPTALTVADINKDGKLDIITANKYSDSVSVLLRKSDNSGYSSHLDYATGDAPSAVTVADINGDGQLDIVNTNSFPNTVSILFGTVNSNGSFTGFLPKKVWSTGTSPMAVAVADMNGDGLLDVITVNDDASSVSVIQGGGYNQFGLWTMKPKLDYSVTFGGCPVSIAVGDMDYDGKADIVTANQCSNTVSVLINTSH